MPHDRFYSPLPLNGAALLPLSPEEAKHLKVMRCKKGDQVEVIDGQGSLALASVIDSEHLQIESVQKFPKPKPAVELMVAILHASLVDWIVEKGTELGVDAITFFPGKLSVTPFIKSERVQRLIISASKQCGRLYLPEIRIIDRLEKPLKPSYYGSLEADAPYLTSNQEDMIFIVGPEKGFHPSEIEQFKKWGIEGRRLNKNVLRAETAAICALSILLTRDR